MEKLSGLAILFIFFCLYQCHENAGSNKATSTPEVISGVLEYSFRHSVQFFPPVKEIKDSIYFDSLDRNFLEKEYTILINPQLTKKVFVGEWWSEVVEFARMEYGTYKIDSLSLDERGEHALNLTKPGVKYLYWENDMRNYGNELQSILAENNYTGYYEFSPVVFNEEETQCVVNMLFSCGRLCGQMGRYFLEKKNGVWEVVRFEELGVI